MARLHHSSTLYLCGRPSASPARRAVQRQQWHMQRMPVIVWASVVAVNKKTRAAPAAGHRFLAHCFTWRQAAVNHHELNRWQENRTPRSPCQPGPMPPTIRRHCRSCATGQGTGNHVRGGIQHQMSIQAPEVRLPRISLGSPDVPASRFRPSCCMRKSPSPCTCSRNEIVSDRLVCAESSPCRSST